MGNYKLIQKSYILEKIPNLMVDPKRSLVLVGCDLGVMSVKLPSYYFVKKAESSTSLLFLNKFFFTSFVKHFFLLYERASLLYFLKIKVRGLGYRVRKVSNDLYYFFFNYTNMFYLYVPSGILIKWYKKSLIMLGNDFSALRTVFSHILLLKTVGPYRLRGLRYPKQIVLLKVKRKKT